MIMQRTESGAEGYERYTIQDLRGVSDMGKGQVRHRGDMLRAVVPMGEGVYDTMIYLMVMVKYLAEEVKRLRKNIPGARVTDEEKMALEMLVQEIKNTQKAWKLGLRHLDR